MVKSTTEVYLAVTEGIRVQFPARATRVFLFFATSQISNPKVSHRWGLAFQGTHVAPVDQKGGVFHIEEALARSV